MKLFLISCLLTVSSCVEVLIADECGEGGPEFWCRNNDIAKKCNAVSYCQENVWKGSKAVHVNTDTCTMCEQYVGTLRMLLKNNATQSEVIAGMMEMCSLMPASVKGMCNTIVELYGKQLIKYLVDYTKDPSKFCSLIGLCKSEESMHTLIMSMVPPQHIVKFSKVMNDFKIGTDYCTMCEQYAGTLRMLMKSKQAQQYIISSMNSLCAVAPKSISGVCTELVNNFGQQIIQMALDYLKDPSKLCTMIHLCSGDDQYRSMNPRFKASQPLMMVDTDYCTYCEQIVGTIHMLIENNATQAEVISGMKLMCSLLPSSYQSQCSTVIDMYGKELIEMAVQYFKNPTKFCQLVGLCPEKKVNTDLRVQSLFTGIGPVIIPAEKEKKAQPKKVDQTTLCTVCEYGMAELSNVLRENSTEKEIKDAVEKLCTYIPGSLVEYCEALMDQYFEQIWELVINQVHPAEICHKIGLCKDVMKIAPKKVVPKKIIKKLPQSPANGVTCELCNLAMEYVEGMLSDESTEEEIKAALGKVCHLLPSRFEQECTHLIQEYTHDIVQLLIKEFTLSPSEICKMIHLCSAKQHKRYYKSVARPLSSVKNGVMCQVCIMSVQLLEKKLTNKATESEVVAALETVCNAVAPSYRAQCDAFIATYAPYILDQLIGVLDPNLICTDIKLCTSHKEWMNLMMKIDETSPKVIEPVTQLKESTHVGPVIEEIGIPSKKNGEICDICVSVMSSIETVLKDNGTVAEITYAANLVCQYLPAYMAPVCKELIAEYLPKLIDLALSEMGDPKGACQKINLCAASDKVMFELLHKFRSDVKSKVFPRQNGEVCDLCKTGMGYMEKLMKDPSTIDEITQVAGMFCQQLPVYKQECTLLVGMFKQYMPQIIKVLLEELGDPTAACQKLRLCEATREQMVIFNKKLVTEIVSAFGKTSGEACDMCKQGMTYMENILNDPSIEQQISTALTALCQYAPQALQAECAPLVKQYVPMLIKMLLSEIGDAEAACKKIGLCPAEDNKIPLKVKSSIQCEVCEVAMKYLDSILGDHATEEEIKQALDQLCAYLPSSFQSECTALINQYSDAIIQLLLQELKPDVICKQLGLCDGAHKLTKKPLKVKASIQCEVCEYAMGYLDQMLGDNATEQQIITAVESLCTYLPTSLKGQCTQLVDQYGREIIHLLQQELDPAVICKELQLCTSAMLKTKAVKATEKNGGLKCEVCTMAMEHLEKMIGSEKSKEKIEDAIKKMCHHLPHHYAKKCDAMVDKYGNAILELIMHEISPKEVCKKLLLCQGIYEKVTKPQVPIQCEICQYAMGYLDGILKDKATEAEITAAVEQVCDYLPASLKGQCDSLVQAYAPQIIDLLVKELDPAVICKELGLCTSKLSLKKKEKGTNVATVKKGSNDLKCTFCTYAMGYLQGLVEKKESKEEIENAVKTLCHYLPSHYSKECDAMVQQYGDMIIDYLVQQVDPSEICQKIGMCNGKSKKVYNRVHPKFMLARKLPRGVSCSVCTYAMGYLDSIITDKRVEKKIEDEIVQLCSHLPYTFKNECDALITEYGDTLLDLLFSELNPSKVCTALKVCP